MKRTHKNRYHSSQNLLILDKAKNNHANIISIVTCVSALACFVFMFFPTIQQIYTDTGSSYTLDLSLQNLFMVKDFSALFGDFASALYVISMILLTVCSLIALLVNGINLLPGHTSTTAREYNKISTISFGVVGVLYLVSSFLICVSSEGGVSQDGLTYLSSMYYMTYASIIQCVLSIGTLALVLILWLIRRKLKK